MNQLNDYYRTYHERMGQQGYTGDRHATTSRFLAFKEELAARLSPGARILDIGCGSGTFAAQSPDFQWEGFDLDVRYCAGKPIKAIEHDIANTPYPFDSGAYDAVTCSEVLEHVFDPIAVHKEAKRLLKRDGLYFLSTPQHTWIVNLLQGFQNLIYDHRMSHTVEHIRTYDFESHKRSLAEAGFVVDSVIGTCGHYCGIVDPMARGVQQFLESKYKVSVPVPEIHLAMGRAHSQIQHTIFIVAKKA